MNAAEELFRTLENFNRPDGSGQSAEQRLLAYCTNVLGAVERIHFDFKEKRDRRNGQPEEDDRKNLAKAVSGFANSAGGVLIWGIADNNLASKPIGDVAQFTTRLLELAPTVADPRVQGIDGTVIHNDVDPTKGYCLLYIPESTLPPHRVILNITEIRNHYYVRSGSTFAIAPHVQLEDMFGRRPRPQPVLSYRIVRYRTHDHPVLLIVLGIENRGRGAAKAPYLALTVHHPYQLWRYGIDGNGNFGLGKLLVATDSNERRFGGFADSIIHPGVVHDITAIEAEINLRANATPDIVIDYRIAVEGVMPLQDRLVITGDELRAVAQEMQAAQGR